MANDVYKRQNRISNTKWKQQQQKTFSSACDNHNLIKVGVVFAIKKICSGILLCLFIFELKLQQKKTMYVPKILEIYLSKDAFYKSLIAYFI